MSIIGPQLIELGHLPPLLPPFDINNTVQGEHLHLLCGSKNPDKRGFTRSFCA